MESGALDKQIKAWEYAVLGSSPDRDDAAHALLNQAMRDWNPDRWRALRTIKFLINNYTNSDVLDSPKEGYREELQQLIVELAKHDQPQIVQMLCELNGREPAKFAKQMLGELNVPEAVNLNEFYLGGQIQPPIQDKGQNPKK